MKLYHLNCVGGQKSILVLIKRKEIGLKMNKEKDFHKILVIAAFGKLRENVRNRLRLELLKKDDIKTIIKQQSTITFNGIHKSDENCDSSTFK